MLTICTHCNGRFEVDESAIGREATCPDCEERFVVRDAADVEMEQLKESPPPPEAPQPISVPTNNSGFSGNHPKSTREISTGNPKGRFIRPWECVVIDIVALILAVPAVVVVIIGLIGLVGSLNSERVYVSALLSYGITALALFTPATLLFAFSKMLYMLGKIEYNQHK